MAWPRWRQAGLLLSLCGLQALLILLIQLTLFGDAGLHVSTVQRVGLMAVLRWGCSACWSVRQVPGCPGHAACPCWLPLPPSMRLCIHTLTQWLGSGVPLDPQALNLSPVQLRWISQGGSWVVALASTCCSAWPGKAIWTGASAPPWSSRRERPSCRPCRTSSSRTFCSMP